MAVRETTDDGSDLETTTGYSTGHACPDCGANVINGQGLYTCSECEFTLAPTVGTADRAFDHPVFLL
ncbi:hypothetical protein [Haloglomus litoreum]|uniref:hypothetical protein n=1 Tax=Haloglomus litoreum TaxID=3034026 RepID=UPI0023E7C50B|nr:hypothetical protein [Haloglomus sp. DT116]